MAKPNRTGLSTRPILDRLFSAGVEDVKNGLSETDLEYLSDTTSLLDRYAYVSSSLADTDVTASFLRYSALRQLEALCKKNLDLPGSSAPERKKAAFESFASSERKCWHTNVRLRHFQNHPSDIPIMVSKVLGLARNISDEICGPMTRLTFHRICEQSGFGPGVNFSSQETEHKHLYYKVNGPHSVTEEALPYVKVLLNHSEHWKQSLISEGSTVTRVRGNRVTTVPKTAVTDRTIAIEPSLNVFIQKGVDSYLKRRLRHSGVTLSNQERNYAPARMGSMRPLHAATIDLSSASDTVSTEIVRWLTPSLWFTLLNDLRSREYTMDKGRTWQEYEKFSSMGNAFTFPLESLIFYALAKACTIVSGGNLQVLRVYGDDIIIDPCAALLLYEVLEFAGFTPNTEKSFIFGPFRETCGADFLAGVDTRPVYVKRLPKSEVESFNLFNRLLRNRVGFQTHDMCEYLYQLVEQPLIGPPNLPAGENYQKWYAGKNVVFDKYFHAPPDKGVRFLRYDDDLQRYVWRIRTVGFKPLHLDTSNWSMQMWYLIFLLGVPGTKHVDSVSRFKKIKPTETYFRWDDLPWRPWLYDCLEVKGS